MTAQEFVDAVRIVISDKSGKKTAAILENPPGRKGTQLYGRISPWFRSLPQEDKDFVTEAMQIASENAIFGFFSILDGVRAIEPRGPKGELELYFVKDGNRTRLNSEMLHDLY